MDIVVGPITEVVKCLVSPLMHHINYLFQYKRNANDLGNQMAKLKVLEADVQGSVERANTRGEAIRVGVQDWLTRVNQIQSEEIELQNRLKDSKERFQGGCSRRYQVGKRARRMIDEVKELLDVTPILVVSDPPLYPPGLDSMPTLDFQKYDSTTLAMNKIKDALKGDRDINMVGVYGTGGVGKTSLMKEMVKTLVKEKLFDRVVMVTVSQHQDLMSIQHEIAKDLGLELKQNDPSAVRARVLFDRLKKEKRKILIVLDDLWDQLNLIDVGIPCGNNCKVVLTTRRQQVCGQMDTQFNVDVGFLSNGDAWALFKCAAGNHIEDNKALCPVAKQIVSECGGLPLAIVTVGRALRAYKEDLSVWKDALTELKKSSSSPPDIEGVDKDIFKKIKLSYDFLDREETKFCLLLCCMFPEDFRISEEHDLLPYVVGERVFGNSDSLMETRDRLHTQIERLKASCLLLNDEKGYVKMHDVIRDVSIWIASNELGQDFVVKSGRGLTHWPDKEENLWKCKRLSLMQNNITKLPDQLEYCSQLVSLSLRKNRNLREIPDGFFQGMISLKILDLNNVCISSIPSSLSCLTDLRVLLLNNTWYSDVLPLDVSLIGKLKKLEILHIVNYNVKNLPQDIGELTNLKSLDLSYNWNLTIPPNIISRLSLLEELCFCDSSENWELEGSISSSSSSSEVKEEDRERSKPACIFEVASLSSLTKLEIMALNPKFLCANISSLWENLTSFLIGVGRDYSIIRTSPTDTRAMCISGMIPPASISEGVRMFLLEQTERLALISWMGLKDVVRLGKMGLNKLRTLQVENCDDVEYVLMSNTSVVDEVVDHHQEIPQIAFSSLERLWLSSLKKLKAICHGPLPIPNPIPSRGGCFNSLRSLYVSDCSSLTVIIPSNLLANLQNLEELEVSSCYGLTEVFNSMGIVDHGQATMTKLRKLKLINLPLLKTVWEGVFSPLSLRNLEKIIVSQLDGLNSMFSIAMAQGLQQLKQLQIQYCKKMVQIIVMNNDNHGIEEEEATMCKTVVLFPQLEDLQLDSLPNLSMLITEGRLLHHHQYNYWPLLETLKVKKCPNLKRLPVSLSPHTETKLREIEVEEKWFNELEWDDRTNDVKMHLQQNVKFILLQV